MDFIRFIASDSTLFPPPRCGLFEAARVVLRDLTLTRRQRSILEDEGWWFSKHLPRPDPDFSDTESWFKCSATEHIRRARLVVELLAELGVAVAEKRTRTTGEIVYQDKFQIVARVSESSTGGRAA